MRQDILGLRIAHVQSPFETVTASLGVASFEPGGKESLSTADLVVRADMQLYQAKAAGRNRVSGAAFSATGADSGEGQAAQ
jgi:diguanylate cyclase (GGDEF)-like protein